MKLLIDQNLSDKLVARLVTRYPGTGHVKESHAERDDDRVIWVRCRDEGYVLLTKDRDLEDERAHPGPASKVILLRIGNTDTDLVMAILTRNEAKIRAFETSPERMLTLK